MRYVQVVLTTDHIARLRAALADYSVPPGIEATPVVILEKFLEQVQEHPEAFPVTGRMAASIKTRWRRLKGPAQPARHTKRKRVEARKRARQARKANRA